MTQTTGAATVDAAAVTRASELNSQVVRLSRALHVMRTHLSAHSPEGVHWSTYGLLFQLSTCGPRRAGALAESVHVDPSTVSRQIDQLVKLGLVERLADPDDGRATLLAATERGEELHRQMRERRDRVTAQMLATWSPDDVETLTTLLDRLTTDISQQMPTLLASIAGTPGEEDPS